MQLLHTQAYNLLLLLLLNITITPCLATIPYLDQNMWSFNTVWSVSRNGFRNSFYYQIYSNIGLNFI